MTRTITVLLPRPSARHRRRVHRAGDGGRLPTRDLSAILDSLTSQARVPTMIAIQIGNGGSGRTGQRSAGASTTRCGTYYSSFEREVLCWFEQQTAPK